MKKFFVLLMLSLMFTFVSKANNEKLNSNDPPGLNQSFNTISFPGDVINVTTQKTKVEVFTPPMVNVILQNTKNELQSIHYLVVVIPQIDKPYINSDREAIGLINSYNIFDIYKNLTIDFPLTIYTMK